MTTTRLAVVLAGRFQPFHRGHYEAWARLVSRFGAEQVWIATSDRRGDAGGRPAPFTFEEKRRILSTLFPVPAERVVLVKSPYRPVEVLASQDPERTAYVAAVGERDAGRLSSRYWAPFPEQGPWEPYPARGYVLLLPPQADDLSATRIREVLGDPGLDLEEKERAFRSWYPSFDRSIFELITSRLSGADPVMRGR